MCKWLGTEKAKDKNKTELNKSQPNFDLVREQKGHMYNACTATNQKQRHPNTDERLTRKIVNNKRLGQLNAYLFALGTLI